MASKLAQGYVDIRVRLESLVNDLNTAQAKVNSSLQQIESRSEKSSATVGNTMTAILGSQALRYLGQQVREVGEALIWSNAQFEDFDFALSKLTGSAERGAQMMKELKEFAISTPFNLTTLMKGTQQLLAFGYATEDVIPLLRSLGDVAASMPEGANDGIERMIGALAQMRNKQKVQAMEMNRLARAGVPMWDALAAVMGTTVPNAMAKVHSGTVSATMGMKALALVASDPRFAGAMEGRAKLFSGLMSNLQDIAWQQAAEIGKPLFEVVKASMEHLFSFLRSDAGQTLVATFTMIVGKIADIIRPLSPILLSVAAPLTIFAAALGGIGLIVPMVIAGLNAIGDALSVMFSPMGLLIGALVTLGYALIRAFQDPTYGRPLRAAIMEIWDVAKKFGAGFMASWSMIQAAADDLIRFLMVAWSDFFGGVATFAKNNQESFQMWGVFIGEIIAGTIKVITQLLRTFWNFARDLWQQYGDKVALVWYWTSLVISNVLEEISVTLNNFSLTSRLIWVQFQIGMLKLFDWIAMKFWEMTGIGLGAVFALGATFGSLWENLITGLKYFRDVFEATLKAMWDGFTALFNFEDPIAALRASYAKELKKIDMLSKDYRSIGADAGRAYREGYDSIMDAHKRDPSGTGMVRETLTWERDKLQKERDDMLLRMRNDRKLRMSLDDTREPKKRPPDKPLPKPPGGLTGDDEGAPAIKFTFMKFDDMWKKVQETMAGTGMQDLARRTAAGAERTAKATEETRDATRDVAASVKKLAPGLA